jgi:alkanesulfonate monooxygenase SsuD/methylene tetrahydromethanopterin reductase-like flavin-dependent oxidoreductase (luciferase family)
MVSVLPLDQPVRLAEEIGMLDQLTRGRLELGIGRGTSPAELAAYGIDATDSRALMEEALQIILMGLSTGAVEFEGNYFCVRGAVSVVRTVQRPYPPLWYPTARKESIPWAARNGMNFLDNFVSSLLEVNDAAPPPIAMYDNAYAEHRFDTGRLNAHIPSSRRGFVRHVVVGETTAEAEAVARAAFQVFADHFNCLATSRGGPRLLRMTFDEFTGHGFLLVGNVENVTDQIVAQLDLNSGDYFVGTFVFGGMRTADILRSVTLFAGEVMPRVRRARRADHLQDDLKARTFTRVASLTA